MVLEAEPVVGRVDGYEKVTGRAQYTEDLPLPYGTACCAILASPYAHANIRSIDASKAERLPGVIAVLTREHLGGMDPYLRSGGFGGGPQALRPFIAIEKVRYNGEGVAAVAAETAEIAEQALELIDVTYEELPTVFDPVSALGTGAPLVHEAIGSNAVGEYVWSWGDVDQGFREADRVFEDVYTFPSVFHYPMENVGGCVAEFRGDEIYLLAPIQHMFHGREEIAHLFGLEPERVHIRSPYIGGGFGAKELKQAHLIALWLARKTGRPVCTTASAEESMRTDCRHQMVYRVKTGLKADGTLWAQEIELLCNEGAYSRGLGVSRLAVGGAWGPYRVRHMRITGRSVLTNRVPAGSFRSVAKPQVTWGYESNLETIARTMGIDPFDFRLKNFLRRGDIIVDGATPLDADYSGMLRQTAEAIGWDGKSERIGSQGSGSPSSGPVRGRGLAATFRHGYSGSDNTHASITLDGQGRLRIHHAVTEIGGGLYNVMSRVAALALGIPQDDIEIAHPDTDSPFSDGIASQRMTVCMGSAVQMACDDLKRQLVEIAVNVYGGRVEEWRLFQGRLWHGERSATLGELVRAITPTGVLTGNGVHRTQRRENAFMGEVPYWGVSTGAAEIEVDPETGELRLLKYATACDVGKAIDPIACRAQIEGAALFGLGNTLYEELVYQDQQILNADPLQYRLPLLPDLPDEFITVMIENGDGPGPQGAKGVGNTPVSPVAPAIGNALYEALGIRIHDLPITAEKILRALGKIQ
jgi:CO/xanthine dehydrogenase Mo-binding subunit